MIPGEQVLLYHFPDDMLRLVESVFHRLNIKTTVLDDSALREKIGYLLGWGGFRPASESFGDEDFDFPHEVMVLSGIKGKRLDAVLKELRKPDMPRITYKAVVTPFNIRWTLRRLCEKMRKEHEYLAKNG